MNILKFVLFHKLASGLGRIVGISLSRLIENEEGTLRKKIMNLGIEMESEAVGISPSALISSEKTS